MPAGPIFFKGRNVCLHKATIEPQFSDPKVLTSDFWTYVELWLKRKHTNDAIFYWSQARQFYIASEGLSPISAPLTSYYCFLNAVKTLLAYRNIKVSPLHGTTGKSTTVKATLSGESVRFQTRGVVPALSALLGDGDSRTEYTLKQLLQNLTFVHRAFVLTFPNDLEIFVPIDAQIVRKDGSTESWLEIYPDTKFDWQTVIDSLPDGLEQDNGIHDLNVLRTRNRIRWLDGDAAVESNLVRLSNYNRRLRKHIFYIRGQPPTWYLKLSPPRKQISIDRSSIVIMLASMHRLSELSRYNPLRLRHLLDSQQNWLISEFIRSAPIQFLDEISTEITGQNLLLPFVFGGR